MKPGSPETRILHSSCKIPFSGLCTISHVKSPLRPDGPSGCGDSAIGNCGAVGSTKEPIVYRAVGLNTHEDYGTIVLT